MQSIERMAATAAADITSRLLQDLGRDAKRDLAFRALRIHAWVSAPGSRQQGPLIQRRGCLKINVRAKRFLNLFRLPGQYAGKCELSARFQAITNQARIFDQCAREDVRNHCIELPRR